MHLLIDIDYDDPAYFDMTSKSWQEAYENTSSVECVLLLNLPLIVPSIVDILREQPQASGLRDTWEFDLVTLIFYTVTSI